MTELLTAAQMRAIEQAAIESGEVTGLELMERAGAGVVEAIYEEWPEFGEGGGDSGRGASPSRSPGYFRRQNGEKEPLRAVVLCGPGNNGGDGFVVARLLHQRGWAVEVFLYGEADKLPPDARVNYERWCEVGEVLPLENTPCFRRYSKPAWADLIVDALFGIGLTRPLSEMWCIQDDLAGNVHNELARVVSIDVPSGLCCDSGKSLWSCEGRDRPDDQICAHLTVTFHGRKPGHLLGEGPELCGKVTVVDIGLSDPGEWKTISRKALTDLAGVRRLGQFLCNEVTGPLIPYLEKQTDEHKFTHGHALILSGGPAQTGAARLAARAALRIGAGLVTLGVPPAAQQEVASQVTAVMLKRVRDAEALTNALQDKRINALCLGPALGLAERETDLIRVALDSGRSCVLDADALTLIARDQILFDRLHPGCVLTPHGGEFARLFPDIAETLNAPATKGPAYSKIDATREAAKRAGCTVLFKGPDTVIADQTGVASVHAAVYDRAAPWLATAGAGDVLAGFITGLLARGFSTVHATESAAWLHAECARHFGAGLIAEDLPEQLPAVLRLLA